MRPGRALALLLVLCWTSPLAAQTASRKPRRQFVTISLDQFGVQRLAFARWPVEDLVGREVAESQFQEYEYESRDRLTTVDIVSFKRRGRGWGVTVYPFGSTTGATLAVRVSREEIPPIALALSGPARVSSYALEDAHSTDVSAGVYVSDRSPGWGLGSRAFIGGGAGKIRSSLGDGSRVFAEGGGGISVGPVGIDIAVKFAFNRLDLPVEHRFLSVPVAIRTSLSF